MCFWSSETHNVNEEELVSLDMFVPQSSLSHADSFTLLCADMEVLCLHLYTSSFTLEYPFTSVVLHFLQYSLCRGGLERPFGCCSSHYEARYLNWAPLIQVYFQLNPCGSAQARPSSIVIEFK